MAFAWTPDLETGNTIIDSEHKTLISAVNTLLDACGQGKGRQELVSSVDFLLSYTKTHFAHEEQLQTQYNYPDIVAHKIWHKSFIAAISELASTLKVEGATIALLGAVNMKTSILITHIKREDVKLARHIKSVSA